MRYGPRVKMVIGALIALVGVWWYLPGSSINGLLTSYSTLTNYRSLLVMFQGSFGIIAAIIGIFIVWIEHDELKMRRELESEDFGRRVQNSVQAVAEGAGGRKEAEETSDEEPVDENEFTCEECGRSFDTKRGLSVHQSQAH